MKVKRLLLCMFLSLALVVTFIPVMSYAENDEIGNQVNEEVVQSDEEIEPDEGGGSASIKSLNDQVSKDKIRQLEDAYNHHISVHGASYNDPIMDDYDDPWIKLYYPEPEDTFYLGQTIQVEFDVYPTWENYCTRPLSAICDEQGNLIDVTEGDIADYEGWNSYEGGKYLNPSKYAPGIYEFMIFNVPCYSDGTYVEGWEDQDDIPFAVVSFKVICKHSWGNVVKIASGYLTNGVECDKCAICGAEANSRVIGGYSTKYVKSAKAKKGKGSITVKWKKQSKKNLKKFDGYEIRYSTSGDINTAAAITVSKKAKSKKIKKLAKKTKYYVWISSYKTVNGVRNYSTWSWGTVKTK